MPERATPSHESRRTAGTSLASLARLGLTGRVFVVTAAIVCAVIAVALAVASLTAGRTADATVRRGLEQSADLVAQFLAGRGRSLAGGARVFVQGPYFRALVAERRRDDILDQAFEAAEQLGADWVFITDERGVLLAKSDEPGASGDALGVIPLVAGALAGHVTSGFGVSRDSVLFQTVAVPVVVPGGAPVGVLVATRAVDSLLARDVKTATAGDVVFYTVDGAGHAHVAASTVGRGAQVSAAVAALSTRAPAPAERPAAVQAATPRASPPAEPGATSAATAAPVPAATLSRSRVAVDHALYDVQGGALTTAGGETVGGYLVLRARDADQAGLSGVRRSLLVAGLLGLALALVAAYAAARRVTRPVRALALAVRRAADGDYADDAALAAALPPTRGGGDEIVALTSAFRAMLADLRDKQTLVTLLSARRTTQSSADVARVDARVGAREASAWPLSLLREPEAPNARATSMSSRGSDWHRARMGAGGHGAPAPHEDASPASAPGPGLVLADRYLLHDVIGAGGMGVVYRATDRVVGETVALKMLRPELLHEPEMLERFKNELRLARRVSHRNVVRTHDLGEWKGIAFLTMELVEGESLADLLRERGAMPSTAVLSIAKQLSRALEVAHAQGVIHGDLKPQNLLVSTDGVVKVSDFGVARLVRRGVSGASARRDERHDARIAGAVIGTPEYMAPEALLGEDAGVRGDIYAAGVVLHECLTGETPFRADTPSAFFARKLDDGSESPREPVEPGDDPIARRLGAVMRAMTALAADARPASAAAVSELLSFGE